MSLDEFARIQTFFLPLSDGAEAALGLRDDAAVMTFSGDRPVAISSDAVIAGVHFPADELPERIARKALRVNLSDMAAMGADPIAYTLVLALPGPGVLAAEPWLERFAGGLAADQDEFDIRLIGGDSVVSDGPVTISITIFGAIGPAGPLLRSGGGAGDDLYVSGTIGDAGLGLAIVQDRAAAPTSEAADFLRDRYLLPRPRLRLGRALAGLATAGMDISDGLLQDLGHLAAASGTGARVLAEQVPLSPAAAAMVQDQPDGLAELLGAGDDYELLFTGRPADRESILQAAADADVPVRCIGMLTEHGPIQVLNDRGETVNIAHAGYRHA